ncbi:hypothetical protein BDZ97DRAFT_51331 [Flammula alnicola]|nr:hypothetical protein BDZ97DRAFT_51331 [Flammula alnicola]
MSHSAKRQKRLRARPRKIQHAQVCAFGLFQPGLAREDQERKSRCRIHLSPSPPEPAPHPGTQTTPSLTLYIVTKFSNRSGLRDVKQVPKRVLAIHVQLRLVGEDVLADFEQDEAVEEGISRRAFRGGVEVSRVKMGAVMVQGIRMRVGRR